MQARTLGVPIMFANMMNMAMPGIIGGTGTSILLITLLLMLTFRSWKAGLLSLIPNLWPIVVMYGRIGRGRPGRRQDRVLSLPRIHPEPDPCKASWRNQP